MHTYFTLTHKVAAGLVQLFFVLFFIASPGMINAQTLPNGPMMIDGAAAAKAMTDPRPARSGRFRGSTGPRPVLTASHATPCSGRGPGGRDGWGTRAACKHHGGASARACTPCPTCSSRRAVCT